MSLKKRKEVRLIVPTTEEQEENTDRLNGKRESYSPFLLQLVDLFLRFGCMCDVEARSFVFLYYIDPMIKCESRLLRKEQMGNLTIKIARNIHFAEHFFWNA